MHDRRDLYIAGTRPQSILYARRTNFRRTMSHWHFDYHHALLLRLLGMALLLGALAALRVLPPTVWHFATGVSRHTTQSMTIWRHSKP